MEVSVQIGAFEADDRISIELSDDQQYVPEVVSDLLRRAADTALRLYGELHPATAKD